MAVRRLCCLALRSRGTKCGQRFYGTAVERYAWAQGAVRISLNVAHDNVFGQALYAKKGWTRDTEFYPYHRLPVAI
jgi:GNAT superfamily N-acetyltransferase